MTFGCDFWLELGIAIGNWYIGMELGIGIGIGDWNWGLGLGIGIGDWDRRLGLGIRDCELGLWIRIGIIWILSCKHFTKFFWRINYIKTSKISY